MVHLTLDMYYAHTFAAIGFENRYPFFGHDYHNILKSTRYAQAGTSSDTVVTSF